MKISKSFLIVSCILSLSACKEKDDVIHDDFVYSRSMVLAYDKVGELKLAASFQSIDTESQPVPQIEIRYAAAETYAFNSPEAADRERYQTLCEANGDVTYNRDVCWNGLQWLEFRRQFMQQAWTKIEIVSDRDYDAAHPAGTSLADITEFGTVTVDPYIRSGYTDEYDWTRLEDDPFWKPTFERFISRYSQSALSPIRKQVTELAPADLKMMGPGKGGYEPIAVLRLTSLPTLEKAHVFTVTFTDTEGKTYPATIYLHFEDLP